MTSDSVEIYCPCCHWEPDGRAHWQCTCGYVWNSFETAAVCPKCQYRWKISQCPAAAGGCGAVSPHVDWYHGLDDLVEELVEETQHAEAATHAHVAVSCAANES
ncbi:hypothetical protein FNT36_11595 [Hymenobacter setariae]|uniref:Uncharacterized protein n=1 Tax=Hymenobacter setariae TaxID=2594794 RepID=A0A558BUD7_9BACT|nr:hypothetical protein [Hymenobacter setariae]TVT40136.1 hypothetical protein FNT36_11595 [Hymenobacter setariae]